MDITKIINNTELNDCLANAAAIKAKIADEYKPQLNELKSNFIDFLVEGNYMESEYVFAQAKKNKKDKILKEKIKAFKRTANKLFNATASVLLNESLGKKINIGNVHIAGQILNFIGRNDIIDTINSGLTTSMVFNSIESMYPKFKTLKEQITNLFKECVNIKSEIQKLNVEIKFNVFESIPDDIKFDKNENEQGLKFANFNKLANIKTVGILKDAKTYTDYLNKQISNFDNDLARGEIVLEKTKHF